MVLLHPWWCTRVCAVSEGCSGGDGGDGGDMIRQASEGGGGVEAASNNTVSVSRVVVKNYRCELN